MTPAEQGQFTYGDAVWILPEEWRGHVFSIGDEGELFLVTIDGQGGRARWCRANELEPRKVAA